MQFLKLARAETKRLAMPDDMLKRNVNVGFSGGAKKRTWLYVGVAVGVIVIVVVALSFAGLV